MKNRFFNYSIFLLLIILSLILIFKLEQNNSYSKQLLHGYKMCEYKNSYVDSLFFNQVSNVGTYINNQIILPVDNTDTNTLMEILSKSEKLIFYCKYVDCRECNQDVIQKICGHFNNLKDNTVILLSVNNKSFANPIRRINREISVYIIDDNSKKSSFLKIKGNCFMQLDSKLRIKTIFRLPPKEFDYYTNRYLKAIRFN